MNYSKFLRGATVVACLVSLNVEAWELSPLHCAVDHVEGKGLGYSVGYTSLDYFLSQPLFNQKAIAFADLRGHIFNNNKTAANAGLGVRWLPEASSTVWGVNAFYDFLERGHRSYQQVSLGVEALGCTWDLRLNGYLPIGKKNRPLYAFEYESIIPFRLKGTEQLAMKGIDAELGYHFCKSSCIAVYAGAGPYYYLGRSTKTVNVWSPRRVYCLGGRVRARFSFLKYCSVELTGTYDSRIKWAGQARAAIMFPFDVFSRSYCRNECCERDWRPYLPVLRNEIIFIETLHRHSSNPEVLNPEHKPL